MKRCGLREQVALIFFFFLSPISRVTDKRKGNFNYSWRRGENNEIRCVCTTLGGRVEKKKKKKHGRVK